VTALSALSNAHSRVRPSRAHAFLMRFQTVRGDFLSRTCRGSFLLLESEPSQSRLSSAVETLSELCPFFFAGSSRRHGARHSSTENGAPSMHQSNRQRSVCAVKVTRQRKGHHPRRRALYRSRPGKQKLQNHERYGSSRPPMPYSWV